ncbi:MAG: hemoglobin, partial [Fimbriimonadaceae bacterium]|nr:hemoglobin [Fimbriimonadaceae bacterium]
GKGEAELDHPELQQRWSRQRTLDQVIDDIANSRDAEAIALCRPFATQPTVFVGILARMMEAGREPLVEFALETIQKHNALAGGRFNGRTLLHFAAGSSCLPVVRQLLSAGVDPDILDSGGHSPLYRVPGTCRDEIGAVIASVLVQAGATVDHCGGVNKSTALHQAARYGNLRIAEVLLNAGASPTAKDKKGLTPLDRARNCRRHDVASLLASR